MLKGFRAKRCLFFTMDGRPVSRGNTVGRPDKRLEPRGKQNDHELGKYWGTLIFIAKQAMLEQHWEYADKDPLYMCIYIYIKPEQGLKVKEHKDCLEKKRFAVRFPFIATFVRKISKYLAGVVYRGQEQIVALQVFKEYSMDERLEVFIGVPDDWEGLVSDLSKAE